MRVLFLWVTKSFGVLTKGGGISKRLYVLGIHIVWDAACLYRLSNISMVLNSYTRLRAVAFSAVYIAHMGSFVICV
jgi:hypothetical protein